MKFIKAQEGVVFKLVLADGIWDLPELSPPWYLCHTPSLVGRSGWVTNATVDSKVQQRGPSATVLLELEGLPSTSSRPLYLLYG